MNELPRAVLAALVVSLAVGVPAGAPAAMPALVATNRCNEQTIDEAAARVRDFDRHGPGAGTAQQVQRFGAIAEIIATLNEEREILNTLCSSDAERANYFAQIAATTAQALALEGDVAAKLNAACPPAAKAFPTMMLADAWLALANVVNEDGGAIPESFHDVIPKIQTRAQAVDLTLPPWADTSAYWRDQIHAKAKAAIATCPSPSPAASPTS